MLQRQEDAGSRASPRSSRDEPSARARGNIPRPRRFAAERGSAARPDDATWAWTAPRRRTTPSTGGPGRQDRGAGGAGATPEPVARPERGQLRPPRGRRPCPRELQEHRGHEDQRAADQLDRRRLLGQQPCRQHDADHRLQRGEIAARGAPSRRMPAMKQASGRRRRHPRPDREHPSIESKAAQRGHWPPSTTMSTSPIAARPIVSAAAAADVANRARGEDVEDLREPGHEGEADADGSTAPSRRAGEASTSPSSETASAPQRSPSRPSPNHSAEATATRRGRGRRRAATARSRCARRRRTRQVQDEVAPAPARMNQRSRTGARGLRSAAGADREAGEQEQRRRRADARPPGDEGQRAHAGVVREAGDRAEGAEADRRHG